MATVSLELSESQVRELVRRLPAESKRALLKELIPGLGALDELVDRGNARIREVCAERGIDWDSLSEEERERLIDDIVHEE